MAAADVSMALAAGQPAGLGETRLPIAVPMSLDVEALRRTVSSIVDSALLEPASEQASTPLVSLERINAPDAALVLSIYTYLATQLPALQQAAQELESTRTAASRREVEVESVLNEAERTRSEAETRADAASAEASDARTQLAATQQQLQQTRTELEVARSASESGSNASSQLQQRVVAVEQEKRDLLALLDREKEDAARKEGQSMRAQWES